MSSCTVLIFLASFFATCSKASLILSEAHSVAFTSVLKMLLYSSQSPLFRTIKPCSKYSLARRFQLPLTLCSACFFFFSLLSEPLHSISSRQKSTSTFLSRIVLFPSFSNASHGTPFALRTVSTANLSVFSTFCLQRIVLTFLAQIGRV